MDEAQIGFHTLAQNLEPRGDGYLGHIPEPWRQGRTAYGGLTAGLSLAAARRAFPDLPPFRSASVNFIGPVTADPVFTSRVLRQGRNVTSVETMAHVGEDVVASCIFIFGILRPSHIDVEFPAPKALAPENCEAFIPEKVQKFLPGFFSRFDTRLIAGGRPMSGASEGYIRTWSRHIDIASRTAPAGLLTIGDVLPPAAMPIMQKRGPVSSVNWLFTVLTDTPQTEDGWWQIEARLTAAHGGYSTQVMRIWNMAGDLVAEGQQCIAIFA